MDPWSVDTLLMCFGGGILGAALGGLWAFVLCATLVILGSLVVLAGGPDFILMNFGIGPIFGPHVGGFCSGIAAATYAVSVKKNHPSESAKDILSPCLDTSWDVMAVGGIFAVGAHILLNLLAKVPVINWGDVLALTVVISCAAARLIFQKEMPWGDMASIKKLGYLNTDEHKISWGPWMAPLGRLIPTGLGAGLFSGALAMNFQNALTPLVEAGTVTPTVAFIIPLLMGWAISGFTLIGLQLGTGAIQKVPIPHVISLLAALGYLYTGSIAIAGIVGVLAALLQELMARMFYNHGSNHIDPPACAAAVGGFILNVLFRPDLLNMAKLFK